MSKDDQNIVTRSRRALNDLQCSPNGKDIAGLSARKTTINNKKALLETTFGSALKKRTSISLPDISSKANSVNVTTSNTSTPHKGGKKAFSTSQCSTPTKFVKKDISIIIEEKENPQHHLLEKASSECDLKATKGISKREKLSKFKEAAVQCSIIDEEMLFSDNVDNTPYWRLLAHKRFNSLLKTRVENEKISAEMLELDRINENLREKNKQLLTMLQEYEELKKLIVESIDNQCDDENEDDSGYDRSHLSIN